MDVEYQRRFEQETRMIFTEQIQRRAAQVFGNKEKADAWLSQPKLKFNGATPLELAQTENGYVAIKDELERINEGYAYYTPTLTR